MSELKCTYCSCSSITDQNQYNIGGTIIILCSKCNLDHINQLTSGFNDLISLDCFSFLYMLIEKIKMDQPLLFKKFENKRKQLTDAGIFNIYQNKGTLDYTAIFEHVIIPEQYISKTSYDLRDGYIKINMGHQPLILANICVLECGICGKSCKEFKTYFNEGYAELCDNIEVYINICCSKIE